VQTVLRNSDTHHLGVQLILTLYDLLFSGALLNTWDVCAARRVNPVVCFTVIFAVYLFVLLLLIKDDLLLATVRNIR